MKNKNDRKLVIQIVWSLCCVFLILQHIIENFWELKILVFSINGNFIKLFLASMLILLPIYFFYCSNNRIVKKIYSILSIVCFICIVFLYMFSFSGNRYFYFYSPHNNRILIAEETSWLLSGGSSFYERKYRIFMKPIKEGITTDDGYRPFSSGEFTVKWLSKNKVQLDYKYGSMINDIWKTEIINLN
ncbi:hypothetical protein [Clostridium arbusti]|uniref:hypothetical protein n=1 Tax=Clostridium arbusti TaxID=1137848 RepID=UPI00028990E9|nr:hypothetical protein [Clostridium arbusti]